MFPTYAPRSRDAADPAPIGRPRAGSGCAALLAYSGTPAQAALLSGATCSRGAASPPFLAWDDANYYELVSGGNSEGSLAGWTVTGGASAVAGSEPLRPRARSAPIR